ncbi:phospho-N-acetylmuramoyl-pentapeptide-transferase [Candidatus Uhrbacteria bacterium]|nr:phospho-N-acetylmuramoyl-pentapeptide-transferase [Candidatus Uhrbacteria bacterium]
MTADLIHVARPLGMTALAFVISVVATPLLIRLLKRFKMGKSIRDAESAPVMAAKHAHKAGTPTMGGIVIWATVLIIVFAFALGSYLFPGTWLGDANFLSRGQTWLPLGLLAVSALVGLADDYLNIRRMGGGKGGGLRMRYRILSYTLVAILGAWWFYTRLDWSQLHVPFYGTFDIGLWYVPFFILVVASTSFSVNEIDGLDGLAGGTLLASFGAFAVIAWSQGRFDLATLCAAIIGALIGFLWFNITPAEVFMGDTGSMPLGTVLAVVALMTNQPLLLLIIGLPFVIESLSVIIQVTSKKLRGKKVFLSAPIHHHLEAIGWSEPRIVMRFWLISFVLAGLGVVLALIDKI